MTTSRSMGAVLLAAAAGLVACSGSDSGGAVTGPSDPTPVAGTRLVAPSVYEVPAGVTFSLSNAFSEDYLFSWSDAGGSFVDVPDPTLILSVGQPYVFQRTTADHPFVITTSALELTGADGSFARVTLDGATIDAATLTPLADFTADPAPTTDAIRWTPAAGEYRYTCRIELHPRMTGVIQVR